ncbi:hypothetical protein IT072_18415 [Leifsonia sp. ZF2019]|uniref:hypothetical protein n=1 Tax=Leifsonia sp. ZF2019 TaxID=2781978 RepID=UPI001CBC814A|nr:hypothetical protein [Leifsonia sp. ZF2019]UAJ79154.1 hypothetical protein IT072_18415 [Leifsonia sp. ZF2019]
MTDAILDRIASGTRDTILASQVTRPTDLETANPSLKGGDIFGGRTRGLDFARRPTLHTAPWRTPIKHVYHDSSAVAPGPGVHGMAGYLAAVVAFRAHYGLPAPSPTNTA